MLAKGNMFTMKDKKTGKLVASGMLKQKIGPWVKDAKKRHKAAVNYETKFADIKPVHEALVKNSEAWLDVVTALQEMVDGAEAEDQMRKAMSSMDDVVASKKAFAEARGAYIKKHNIKTY